MRPVIAAMVAGANEKVTRYDITPDAQKYLEKYYVPTGNLQIPVVSVHNVWDPLVPFFHEPAFGGAVAAAGASSMLLQRSVFNYGHCNFPTSAVVAGHRFRTGKRCRANTLRDRRAREYVEHFHRPGGEAESLPGTETWRAFRRRRVEGEPPVTIRRPALTSTCASTAHPRA